MLKIINMDKIELRPMEKELLRLCKGKHRFSKKINNS